jgi:hypothetical protein
VAVKNLERRIAGFSRGNSWPPPAEFFAGEPIGLVYYIQNWFRYNLQEWISKRMR